jgi:hypothetical protein
MRYSETAAVFGPYRSSAIAWNRRFHTTPPGPVAPSDDPAMADDNETLLLLSVRLFFIGFHQTRIPNPTQ